MKSFLALLLLSSSLSAFGMTMKNVKVTAGFCENNVNGGIAMFAHKNNPNANGLVVLIPPSLCKIVTERSHEFKEISFFSEGGPGLYLQSVTFYEEDGSDTISEPTLIEFPYEKRLRLTDALLTGKHNL